MSYIHHSRENNYSALKYPRFHLFIAVLIPLLQPLAITNILTVSIVLPFPECHVVEIMHYVAFFRLSSLLRFFHVFSWFNMIAHFFYCWIEFPCMDFSQLIYSFTYWRAYWLLPSFGNYKESCSEHLCTGFCVDVSFRLIWMNT